MVPSVPSVHSSLSSVPYAMPPPMLHTTASAPQSPPASYGALGYCHPSIVPSPVSDVTESGPEGCWNPSHSQESAGVLCEDEVVDWQGMEHEEDEDAEGYTSFLALDCQPLATPVLPMLDSAVAPSFAAAPSVAMCNANNVGAGPGYGDDTVADAAEGEDEFSSLPAGVAAGAGVDGGAGDAGGGVDAGAVAVVAASFMSNAGASAASSPTDGAIAPAPSDACAPAPSPASDPLSVPSPLPTPPLLPSPPPPPSPPSPTEGALALLPSSPASPLSSPETSVPELSDCASDLSDFDSELSDFDSELSELVVELLELAVELSEPVVELSELVAELSELVVELSELVVELSELVFELSELVVESSDLSRLS
ncbi:unnamed protein product [Closterium sp. NIES-65]|nr:unnamed protein product [Closterium sp. NIES-65]